jgi:hypothetical protein
MDLYKYYGNVWNELFDCELEEWDKLKNKEEWNLHEKYIKRLYDVVRRHIKEEKNCLSKNHVCSNNNVREIVHSVLVHKFNSPFEQVHCIGGLIPEFFIWHLVYSRFLNNFNEEESCEHLHMYS